MPGRKFFWIFILIILGLNTPQIFSTSANGFGELIITEFLAANHAGLIDEDGQHSDWIEIHNPGRRAVNLAGWALTDNPTQPDKWAFPDITLDGQAYLLVFASGKDRKPTRPDSHLHTNFKLDQSGEFLGLYNTFAGEFIDIAAPTSDSQTAEAYPEQIEDVSYGRFGDRQDGLAYVYLTSPTPGRPNDEASARTGLVEPVNFSLTRGFYDAPFTVELSTATSGATIRYTTDGSQPTESHGAPYTAPITIETTTLLRAAAFKPDFLPSLVDTHTYIFLDDVLAQPPNPPGFPKTWGGYKGSPVSADYEMDPEIVTHPRYRESIKESLKSIPTLSLVTDIQSFYDLYTNPRRRGRAWERPVSVEFFEADQEQQGFQIEAGLRMQGELGRREYMPKHGFRLFFRREYGAARLEYPLFPDSPVEAFDTLVLRGGVNRSYAGYPKREEEIRLAAYTRDEWLRRSQIAMSGSGAHGIFVHLYLNGLYWGLYNVVERPDASFMSLYFGGAEQDWQAFNHAETLSNSSERFKAIHQLAAEGRLGDPQKYAAISSYLDVPHFIDYLILNWYAGNLDWAFNNWYAGVQNPAGKVKYFVWDGERTWFEGADIFMGIDEYREQPNLIKPLLAALLESPDFKMELADRLYKHLFNNGSLTNANAQARWLELAEVVEPAIIAESARWGDTRLESPLTQADWFRARDDVLTQMEGNAARLLTLARQEGYYPPLDPPVFNRYKGPVSAGFELTMTASDGAIYYTVDGTDPRMSQSGAMAPNATAYNSPLVLTTTTQVKARLFDGDGWSALSEATFSIAEQEQPLRLTELMYHPLDGNDYEFIELKNVGRTAVNLAGMSFEGVRFTFPAGEAPLAPGELIVLVRNPTAFSQKYPDVTIGGVYDGQLANNGETIILKDATGKIIVSLEYDDENGWPVSPDGQGDSLVFVDLDQDPGDPNNWRASASIYGSPGVHDLPASGYSELP